MKHRLAAPATILIVASAWLLAVSSFASPEKAPESTTPPEASPTLAELVRRIDLLETEIKRLREQQTRTQPAGLSRQEIETIADARATALINRHLGQAEDSAIRVPANTATGGITMRHLIVGRDRPVVEDINPKGTRVAVAVAGPKSNGNAFMVVYALPVKDLMLRPEYLIHQDGFVPYIDGLAQTHFMWQGHFLTKRMAPAGIYKIFTRIIIKDMSGRIQGSAMRYWGSTADPARFAIRIK
jgi:hypothetical protein